MLFPYREGVRGFLEDFDRHRVLRIVQNNRGNYNKAVWRQTEEMALFDLKKLANECGEITPPHSTHSISS